MGPALNDDDDDDDDDVGFVGVLPSTELVSGTAASSLSITSSLTSTNRLSSWSENVDPPAVQSASDQYNYNIMFFTVTISAALITFVVVAVACMIVKGRRRRLSDEERSTQRHALSERGFF